MKILFIGDIVGRVGRRTTRSLLPVLRERHRPDLVIANCENSAGGIGVTEKIGEELLGLGIDVLTSGNHVWDKRDVVDFLTRCDRIVRPANYPPGATGRGATIVEAANGVKVGVINLQGRVFMREIDCPFRVGTDIVSALRTETPVLFVDMHAEATSEKVALGWHLSGTVSAVIGTHTHVQTADERILEKHTAYLSDAGMTGPVDSVIGIRTELSIARFVTQLPQRFEAAGGIGMLNGVVVEVDATTGAATGIERVVAYEEASAAEEDGT